MEKLELKQVQNYLSEGVKFISSMDVPFDEHFKNPKWTLYGINKLFGDYCLLTEENNDAYAIHTCKLLLHPLSRLTDEQKKFLYFETIGTDNDMYGNVYEFIEYLDETPEYHLPYCIIRQLSEWHMDWQGLIEKGLAIEKQPLK